MHDQEREDLRIPLQVEEVSVSRREIKKANVQIALITGTRELLIDEELTHARVEFERVPIDRVVEVAPPIRQEGDITIIPVVEEVVVVERRLVLKEEVRVQRVSTKSGIKRAWCCANRKLSSPGSSRTVSLLLPTEFKQHPKPKG